MDFVRRILSYFNPKSQENFKPKSEEEEHFILNGRELQAELIAFSNGRYGIPLRSFTAKELVKATNGFAGDVSPKAMIGGHLEGRRILVIKYGDPFWSYRRYEAIHDIVIAAHMSHLKNVLKLVGCCLEFEVPSPVYEYVDGGPLSDLLKASSDHNKLLLPWRRRIAIASDIASTILYLHTGFPTPVIYKDLNPSNVMIDEYGVAKLFNFSASVTLPPGKLFVMENRIRGTYGFMDPDYAKHGYVSQKTDVYSFGMLLLALLYGKIRDKKLSYYVMDYIHNQQYKKLIDPRILEEGEEGGTQNPFESFLDLALMCTRSKHEERPEMIYVAKELRLMEKGIFHPLPKRTKLEIDECL